LSKPHKIVRKIRAKIPEFDCLPGCHKCCGPVVWSKWEIDHVQTPKSGNTAVCPYLADSGCEVYRHRPIMCRLFGTSEDMPCPVGRGPLERLSLAESKDLLRSYWQLPKFTIPGYDRWFSRRSDEDELRQALLCALSAVFSQDHD